MNVKTILAMGVGTGLIAALTVTPPVAVAGVITNHSGTICKNYDNFDVSYMDYLASGTMSSKGSNTQVICPLVRGSTSAYGAYAYVDIMHVAWVSTQCTLYSYTDSGSLLGSYTLSWYGNGFHEFSLHLGSGRSNTWSNYAVLCNIPGSYAARIIGIGLSEQ